MNSNALPFSMSQLVLQQLHYYWILHYRAALYACEFSNHEFDTLPIYITAYI